VDLPARTLRRLLPADWPPPGVYVVTFLEDGAVREEVMRAGWWEKANKAFAWQYRKRDALLIGFRPKR
jgi:hypothetical protein